MHVTESGEGMDRVQSGREKRGKGRANGAFNAGDS